MKRSGAATRPSPAGEFTALPCSDESETGRFEQPRVNLGVGEDVTIAEPAATVARTVGFDAMAPASAAALETHAIKQQLRGEGGRGRYGVVTLHRPSNVDDPALLAGTDPARIPELALEIVRHGGKAGRKPALWDGQAAQRIVAVLKATLSS